ncbi:MAG: sialate O-acetylesterase [Alistipes sp.]|nr:sialate O-acetylesterase [Alistipes sp.]
MKRLIMTVAAACLCWGASAAIVLPKVLGSNMVLQQQSEVNLWGKADANAKVTVEVSWSGDKVQTHSDAEGRWAVKVATPAASFDPQTITISDGESLTLENILIGDVWVCSGQSNMEMPVKGFGNQPVENSLEYIMRGGEEASRIRMFTVQRSRSYDKDMEDCAGGEWQCASPESVANFSATAYFFAYNLTRAVNIPVGVIATDWGGTRVESWMPLSALKDCVTEEQFEQKHKIHDIKPSELYCAMIAPIRNFTARGFLWYQGEANLGDIDHYDTMMARMVEQWRSDWGDEDNSMPFYYAQIAPYVYGGSNDIAYPLFVETQVRAMNKIPNSGMAGTTDIGAEYCIHPAQKFEVGERLAALALMQTYGQSGFEPRAPRMESYEIRDGKVTVRMSRAGLGLTPWYGEPIKGFEIAGADRVFHKAKASISGNSVTVWSDEVAEPVAVRYAFRNYIECNLHNMFGIPAVPFRTDDWNDVK